MSELESVRFGKLSVQKTFMTGNRPPIVVILGHVDHGKTSLLDYLRHSNVVAREAGGITQHIRSFQLKSATSPITFIDTPGHAAFASMRQRGSKIADIAVLVVAGNDGVMPQTKQSITFIKEAGIPFIVAINKSDLPTFDPDRVKTQLTESEIVVEDYGGDVPTVNLSAKTGQNVPELLELINLIASLNPPQADSDTHPEAVVLESRLDPQKGPVAVVVVRNGTLKVGQSLFQTTAIGKVRALVDSDGNNTHEAGPSIPVEVIGLTETPAVGSIISDVPVTQPSVAHTTAKDDQNGEVKIIIKADVAGSLEAILGSLPEGVNVLASGTGAITDSDIDLAKTSGSLVIAFNTKASASVAKLAEVEKVKIVSFKIIYELFDYLEKQKSPVIIEETTGKAEILAEFKMDGVRIAGCRCTEGSLSKGDTVKVMRGEQVVGVSKIKSLQSGKVQVEKIKSGAECGLTMAPYVDFRLQDSIIAYITHGETRP